MKRLLSFTMTVILLFTVCISAFSAAAASAPTLSLESVGAEAGKLVQMQLSLAGNPGIVAMHVTVQFDNTVLHLAEVDNGEVFPASTATFGKDLTGNAYTMLWLDALATENYTANGTLATLTFRVDADAAAGQSAVTLSYDSKSVFDCDLMPVATFVMQNGAVTVSRPTVPVTSVTVSLSDLTLHVGQTNRLTATVLPTNATDRTVSWQSQGANIASVDAQGNVTARGAGTTTITVTTTDGGKKAFCTVSVTPVTVAVTGVSVPNSLTMNYKDGARLTATVEPANATNPAVIWSSDNAGVVEVDANGNLTTHRKGTATITATTVDGGKTASCRVTVQYTFMQKIIIYLLFGFIWYVK